MKTLRDFLNEDGAAGASSAAPVNVDGGVAGTSGKPPVTKAQQKKYKRSQIGLIKAIPPVKI